MDIPRLFALKQYWARHPPLRDMVQAYLGIKTSTPAVTSNPTTRTPNSSPHNTQADLDAFIEMFQAAGGRRG